MNTATATVEKNPDHLRYFDQELPVVLNEHELQTYGKILAEKVREKELAEEKKKQSVAEYTTRIKIISNEIKRLADARSKGEELRGVRCAERLHGNVIEIVRLDRGEVVGTRPADLQDLQMNLPGTSATDIPEDLDEGPRGDNLGGPDKTGVAGQLAESSSGDTVWNGAPDDVDDDTRIRDACGVVVTDDDETVEYEGSTVHAACKPDDAPSLPHLAVVPDEVEEVEGDAPSIHDGDLNEDDEDDIDRKLKERESDPDYGGAVARKATSDKEKAAITKAETPKTKGRERSKAKNDAKPKRKK